MLVAKRIEVNTLWDELCKFRWKLSAIFCPFCILVGSLQSAHSTEFFSVCTRCILSLDFFAFGYFLFRVNLSAKPICSACSAHKYNCIFMRKKRMGNTNFNSLIEQDLFAPIHFQLEMQCFRWCHGKPKAERKEQNRKRNIVDEKNRKHECRVQSINSICLLFVVVA